MCGEAKRTEGEGSCGAAGAAWGAMLHATPGQSLATLQNTLTRDAGAKKAQLLAKCKQLEGVEMESKTLRHDLKVVAPALRRTNDSNDNKSLYMHM